MADHLKSNENVFPLGYYYQKSEKSGQKVNTKYRTPPKFK